MYVCVGVCGYLPSSPLSASNLFIVPFTHSHSNHIHTHPPPPHLHKHTRTRPGWPKTMQKMKGETKDSAALTEVLRTACDTSSILCATPLVLSTSPPSSAPALRPQHLPPVLSTSRPQHIISLSLVAQTFTKAGRSLVPPLIGGLIACVLFSNVVAANQTCAS